MLKNRFDQAAKDMLRASLEPDGLFLTEVEANAPTQRIDGWFVPDTSRPPTRKRLGLLGNITEQSCTIELFHATPSVDEVSECVRKLLNFRHVRALREPSAPLPWGWILSSGRPAAAIEGFAFQRAAGWPDGIYHTAPRLFTGIVAISELPEVPETLFLRLMGAGKTFQRALVDLKNLPPEAPARTIAGPVLLHYRLEVAASPRPRTRDEEEFLMITYENVEAWEREQREKGLEEGLQNGLQKGLEEGLQNGLREAVTDSYEARFGAMPAELTAALREIRDEAALRSLVRLTVTGSPEQIRERLLAGCVT